MRAWEPEDHKYEERYVKWLRRRHPIRAILSDIKRRMRLKKVREDR